MLQRSSHNARGAHILSLHDCVVKMLNTVSACAQKANKAITADVQISQYLRLQGQHGSSKVVLSGWHAELG